MLTKQKTKSISTNNSNNYKLKIGSSVIVILLVMILGSIFKCDNTIPQLKQSEEENLLERKKRGEILTYQEQFKLCYWLSKQSELKLEYDRYCTEFSEEYNVIKKKLDDNNNLKNKAEAGKIILTEENFKLKKLSEVIKELVKSSPNYVRNYVTLDCYYFWESMESKYKNEIISFRTRSNDYTINMDTYTIFKLYIKHYRYRDKAELFKATKFKDLEYKKEIHHLFMDIQDVFQFMSETTLKDFRSIPSNQTNNYRVLFKYKTKNTEEYYTFFFELTGNTVQIKSYYPVSKGEFYKDVTKYSVKEKVLHPLKPNHFIYVK